MSNDPVDLPYQILRYKTPHRTYRHTLKYIPSNWVLHTCETPTPLPPKPMIAWQSRLNSKFLLDEHVS